MPQDSQNTCTQLADVTKDLWETLWGQQLEPTQDTQGHPKDTRRYGGKGLLTLRNTVKYRSTSCTQLMPLYSRER